MVPTWLQNRPKLGPCWAPKPSWTRPRAKPRRCEKHVDFWSHLGAEKSPEPAKKTLPVTRPAGVVFCKNCKNLQELQELPRNSSQLHPLAGGAGSKTPTGRVTGAPPFCMELSPCRNEVVHFISVCMHFCIIAYMHTSIYAYNANCVSVCAGMACAGWKSWPVAPSALQQKLLM